MHVKIIDEIRASQIHGTRKARDLCFQKVVYVESETKKYPGNRFIYRDENDKLLVQRGQANLDDLTLVKAMLSVAEARGWHLTKS
ncbi:hypothetical protein BIT28_14195 [Photobacterium proteolyticum]|uniref:Uncharacterized protein n=1 Tax=Photobacterium proteolyticum TaxID=1903952 RepID=A0A1Q9H1S2_9GAMM|nr:hypothetical protein [Photobacterium proteolyticum]OLQ81670.1 hypothetical protein BIT28_14195 [Photobacterium proteolyticum]